MKILASTWQDGRQDCLLCTSEHSHDVHMPEQQSPCGEIFAEISLRDDRVSALVRSDTVTGMSSWTAEPGTVLDRIPMANGRQSPSDSPREASNSGFYRRSQFHNIL